MGLFLLYFCRVCFTNDPSIGTILKKKDGSVEATIYASVSNWRFFRKKITFIVGGGDEYHKGYLKYDIYKNLQIEIREGSAKIVDEGSCIIIPGGKTVSITITAQNEYIKNENTGKIVYLKRAAPEDIKIVKVRKED